MFSKYKYLIVNLVFPDKVFMRGIVFSDCAFFCSLTTCTFFILDIIISIVPSFVFSTTC